MSASGTVSAGANYDSGGARGSDMWMEASQSSARLFEKSKIKALQGEREAVQKKTFTKWVNSHLRKVEGRCNDLYSDLRDGRKLVLLLEILSGEKLPKPSKGRMRIHMLENVQHALHFLKQQRVHLENIGAQDIVDGNQKITLGLIWTIILRFQIQDIMIEMESSEKRSAKDALLLWCQSKTIGYKNVTVTNFTTSWRDGLAFNAIIHKHRPDLIEYEKLKKEEPIKNLNLSFECAERDLGIAPLLDAPDINVDYPDEKSIMTYIASYYHYFSKMKKVEVSGSRIQKVVLQALENDRLIKEYESISSNLIEWIQATTTRLSTHEFGNSLRELQQQMLVFNQYRTQEKPPKFVEKGNLEVRMFELTSKLRFNHQKMYVPAEGKMISDINKAWDALEESEHAREVALREELIRQEHLEQLASRFHRKAALRETWLIENKRLLSQDNFGTNLNAVEASVKKHEAIETDIKAYVERINAVEVVAKELEAGNYHATPAIIEKKDKVLTLWEQLLELLKHRSSRLRKHHQLYKVFQEMIYIINWIDDTKVVLTSDDYGQHFFDVEDLLQKHSLVDADVAAQAERVEHANAGAASFLELEPEEDNYKPDVELVKAHQEKLADAYKSLCDLVASRKMRLEESLQLHSFYRDVDEEIIWLSEKEYFLSSTDYGRDVHTTMLLLKKHEGLQQELVARKSIINDVVENGNSLQTQLPYATENITKHSDDLKDKLTEVERLALERQKCLEEALNIHQYLSDCHEVSANLNELDASVSIDDVGQDEDSVEELIKQHQVFMDEATAASELLTGLEQQRLNSLTPEHQENPDVLSEKARVEQQYADLLAKAKKREMLLNERLSTCQLYSEATVIRTWLTERESQLQTYLRVDPSYDLEQCQEVEQRFEGFEQEMKLNDSRLEKVNKLADELLSNENGGNEDMAKVVQSLNRSCEALKQDADDKKAKLHGALKLQQFYSVVTETRIWIVEKSNLLSTVDESANDLSSVVTLQRRLNSIERDIAAMPSKLQDLNSSAVQLAVEYPEEGECIQTKCEDLQSCWSELSSTVEKRKDALAESGEMNRFIIDLSEFLDWLQASQAQCASEDIAQNLQEAEALLELHCELKTTIDQREVDFAKLVEDAPKFIPENPDLQQQSLQQQLSEVVSGWNELGILWQKRKEILEQSLNLQIFLRDAKHAEALLGQQELFLSKQETAPTVESVENIIRKHEDFSKKMTAHNDKINHVVELAEQLAMKDHFAKDKIEERAKAIHERKLKNKEWAESKLAQLHDDLKLKQFYQDADDMTDWLMERLQTASEEQAKDLTNVRSKLIKHQAFEAEMQANRQRIDTLGTEADDLRGICPESKEDIDTRMERLESLWNDLNTVSSAKAASLTEANRQQDFHSEITNLDKYVKELLGSLEEKEIGKNITTVRENYNKHKVLEKEVEMKHDRMVNLMSSPDDDTDKLNEERAIIEERFASLEVPLVERRNELEASLKFYQFKRDVEDEMLWIGEKEPILQSQNFGKTLHEVQRQRKKFQNLCTEVDGHEPLIQSLQNRGKELIDEQDANAVEVEELCDSLMKRWENLKSLSMSFKLKLEEANAAKQYYFDANEAESWMSEQELYMMADDRGKDEANINALIKKQDTVKGAIADYGTTIEELRQTANALTEAEHPESEEVIITQKKVDDLYAHLQNIASEREGKLDENLKLFQINREVDDLEAWIAEMDVIFSSQENGQDFDHVQMLQENFERMALETTSTGKDRVAAVNQMTDQLIDSGHTDAATISEWKDGLNEAWENLLEAIVTRRQVLESAHEYHKFFQEAKDLLGMIQEKEKQLSSELGRDHQSVFALKRHHKAFEADLQPLEYQVKSIQQFATELTPKYAGDKSEEITDKEREVVDAWKALLHSVGLRTAKLGESDDFQRLLMLINDLQLWINEMRSQIEMDKRPRDISGCETLMKNHQDRKKEIDSKEEKFNNVSKSAETMIANNHYASDEIKQKVDNLLNDKQSLDALWETHWEDLQLDFEVLQFARDAHLAEEWMVQQDGQVNNPECGQSIDQVAKLIEKHIGFEKLLNAQEERFKALERLTTFELRAARTRQLQAAQQEKEERERLARLEQEEREQQLEAQRALENRLADENSAREADDSLMSRNDDSINADASARDDHSQRPADAKKDETKTAEHKISGVLQRKQVMDVNHKKSSQRQWKQFFVVLSDKDLMLYKEANDTGSASSTYSLSGSSCEVASSYHKKKNVFKLKLHNGEEFLFQAKDIDDMSLWIQHIRASSMANGSHFSDAETPESPKGSPKISPKKEKRRSRLFKKSAN